MPVDRSDLITLTEAMQRYGHSRPWWTAQVQAGPPNGLTAYDIPGDRNIWLSVTELERFFEPRPRQPQADEGTA